ncbi:MAG TPA: hypothetical protein VLG46_09485 [Anaerolineae bacterium]|nr:hypothetical protein [Anaerolineae bacterium]
MERKITLALVLLIVLALPLISACSDFGDRSTAASASASNFVAETRIEVDELEIKPAMSYHTLEIKTVDLEGGQLTLRLLTPDGDVQWKESFTAPAHYQKTLDLDMVLGTWKLEIELKSATGNYDIQWRATN